MSLEAGLRKLKEKADAASPGPRQIRTDEGSSLYDVVWQRGTYLCMSVLKEDAEFIAACSPETVRALVDVAEADDLLVRWLMVNVQGALSDLRAQLHTSGAPPSLIEKVGGIADNIDYMARRPRTALARLERLLGEED